MFIEHPHPALRRKKVFLGAAAIVLFGGGNHMFKNLAPGAIGIRCGWVEGLDLAREAGFDGADLSLGEAQKLAAEQDAEAVKALYGERGLQLGGWGLPVN